MKVNTIGGAAVAALILLVTGYMALLQTPQINGFSDVSEVQWTILIGGALTSFFKDYQALSTRRLINRVSGTGDGGI